MQVVRFVSDDPQQKKFAAAVRKNVNDWFRSNNRSTKGGIGMVIKAVLMLSLYLAPFILILTLPLQGWLVLLLCVLIGIGEAGIGMAVMHDAVHGAFSGKEWVNRLFGSTMFLLGSNVFNWKIQHNMLHHSFTNIYGFDQDIGSKVVIRLSEHAPHRWFHRYQFIYAYFFYGLMTLAKLFSDFSLLADFNRQGIIREQGRKPATEFVKLALIKVIYFGTVFTLPFLFTDFSWWQILLGFSVMHITAGIIMSTIFQMAHVVEGAEQPLPDENHVIKNEWMVHQLRTTSDFARNSRFLAWYAGGLNHQVEHHLFPNMCHMHYPKIAPIVEQTAREFGIPYNLKPGFVAAFRSHARRLRELGQG